jgi:hypothetical protein
MPPTADELAKARALIARVSNNGNIAESSYLPSSLIDSGCTRSMTSAASMMEDLKPLVPTISVQLADGVTSIFATHSGTLVIPLDGKVIKIPDSYLVPGLVENLVSVKHLTQHGFQVNFSEDCGLLLKSNGQQVAILRKRTIFIFYRSLCHTRM